MTPPAPEGPIDVHVVSHTHWDREWYLTREQFRLRLVDLIDRVLDLLEREPRFRHFHLDGQTIVLEDYLEVRPEARERLRRHIAAGRILVGPWYVMPDEFLVSGEALVRNLALGHRIAAEFGAPMPVGYLPDPFGHVAQMPQILAGFGLDNAVLWRGFGGPRAEYWWEAPDGSRVLLLHLPREGYCNAVRLPLVPARMLERSAEVIGRERERTAFGQVLLMSGVDHLEPHPALPDLVDRLAEQPGLRVRHSTLPAYVDAVRKALPAGDGLETVEGELRGGEEYAHLLPGVLSARTYLKQANARVQTALERWAEPLSVIAWLAGAPYPSGLLDYAWRVLLQNQPHDSICGCSVDAVHEENMTRYARAGQVAEGIAERALEFLARQVTASPAGMLRCLVFNTSAEARSSVVEGVLDLPLESAEPGRTVDPEALDAPVAFFPGPARVASIVDSSGKAVPFQVLGEEDVVTHIMSRYETPWAVRARRLRLAWWADDVPPCGYAAFDLVLSQTPPAATAGRIPPVTAGERWAENEFLRLSVNDDGTLDVLDKRSGRIFKRCWELEDVADVGDEYNYSPPARDRRIGSAEAGRVAVSKLDAGPLRATLRVDLELPLPAEAALDRTGRSERTVGVPVSLRVQLDAGSPRVSFIVAVDNRARDHRLRIVFPTGSKAAGLVRAETAFGVVRRSARRPVPEVVRTEMPVSSAPLQSFVDAGDEDAGVTVLAEGLMEYEVLPGDEARVGLTLLRCVGHLSRDDLSTRPGGHAGPGLETPGAQCQGGHEFRLAMEPHAAPPPEPALHARAASFVAPCRVVPVARGEGRFPARLSFLEVAPAGAVLSALKKAQDRESVVLRLFNPGRDEMWVKIKSQAPISSAFALDLLERRRNELALREGRAEVTLGPARIETIELVPAR